MYSKKMKANCIKENVWKSFFVNSQIHASQVHYRLTSLQIIFRGCKYMNAFEYYEHQIYQKYFKSFGRTSPFFF